MTGNTFEFELPHGYNLACFAKTFGRDPDSPSERLAGSDGVLATPDGHLVRFRLAQIVSGCTTGDPIQAMKALKRIMGLGQDVDEFESLVENLGLHNLIADRKGARVPQSASLFDGLIWAVIGQQINLRFAYKLRQRLFQNFGQSVGDGLFATPTPARLAELTPEQLQQLQFSRRKGEYLIGIAQKGQSWLDELEQCDADTAKNQLMSVRGLGVWSTEYILMRSLSHPDCVPYGDTGLRSGLVRFYKLERNPTLAEIEELMAPFIPYRSLATYHLWQSLA